MAWSAGVLVLRHLAWRQMPWHTHVFDWTRSVFRKESFRAVWPSFVVSRVLVMLIAYVAVMTIGYSPPRSARTIENDVLDLYARFDAGWYYRIASLGYGSMEGFTPTKQNTIAFFPGLPILMRTVASWLDVNRWLAGILIVVVTFFFGLAYLYRLAREDLPADQAKASLMFLAFYPFAVCYSAVLTEAVFLLIAAAAFLHFRRDEVVKAAPFALFAGLLRPNGFLLGAPLALIALIPFARARGWLPGAAGENDRRWAPLLGKLAVATLPVLGLLLYSAYVYSLTGDPFAWAKAQQGWGRKTAGLLDFIDARADLIASYGWSAYPRAHPVEIFEAVAALFAIGAIWPVTRRFGLPYGVFVATAVLPPFISMGSVSLGRYTAPLFPIFLWLAATVPPERRPYWIAVFAAGQALVATLFFTGRAPY
jgi:hypothetical protein